MDFFQCLLRAVSSVTKIRQRSFTRFAHFLHYFTEFALCFVLTDIVKLSVMHIGLTSRILHTFTNLCCE